MACWMVHGCVWYCRHISSATVSNPASLRNERALLYLCSSWWVSVSGELSKGKFPDVKYVLTAIFPWTEDLIDFGVDMSSALIYRIRMFYRFNLIQNTGIIDLVFIIFCVRGKTNKNILDLPGRIRRTTTTNPQSPRASYRCHPSCQQVIFRPVHLCAVCISSRSSQVSLHWKLYLWLRYLSVKVDRF